MMSGTTARHVVIAGAGIAGLTAALAFARRGFSVSLFERTKRLEVAGAGLQLSPNATRVLRRLGVLSLLKNTAVRPEAVILRDAASLCELSRVPLGDAAERRWGAPYLVAHRADLQEALLTRVMLEPDIRIHLGAPVRNVKFHDGGATVTVEIEGRQEDISCRLLVGADGVHSTVRTFGPSPAAPRFAGENAWRATVSNDSDAGRALMAATTSNNVGAFLRPGFHLIAYPISAGTAVNLVAFTKAVEGSSASSADLPLRRELARCASPLRGIIETKDSPEWTFWPIYTVDPGAPWVSPKGLALIGDAAHAMTPYAAQGAAMAIEDAVTLAWHVAEKQGGLGPALSTWEETRRRRITAVARRAALNKLAWHAVGPVAFARDIVLRMRGGQRLASDLDWLYGWVPEQCPRLEELSR